MECTPAASPPTSLSPLLFASDACRFREGFLLLIECQDRVGSQFDGDGDMEKIHPADGNRKAVFGTQFTGGTNGVAPVEFGVRPVAETDFLFEEADQCAGFALNDRARAFELAQGIEDLNALPRGPENPVVGKTVE